MKKFDAHVHSKLSDGTQDPSDLVHSASMAGLDVIALTDHDTFAGIDEATTVAAELGLTVVPGVELSSTIGGISAHILAYMPNREDAELLRVMEKIRQSRMTRVGQMASNLAADYPNADWKSLEEGSQMTLGRPHLADVLVEAGYFVDRDEAFQWALSPRGPYYVHQWSPSPPEMVEIIRNAQGVPVLAHPYSSRRRPLPREVLKEMIDAGLFGMERDHREHDAHARQEVGRLAQAANLETTGGSDYHGAGKPNELGENLTDMWVLDRIIEQGYQERRR